jgi:antagonist of KipI
MLVIDGGFLTTIQDLGRDGCEHLGVPVSGAMDRFALLAANALVGNPRGAAGLECALAGCSLLAEEETLVAATGVGFMLAVDGREVLPWTAAYVRAGEKVALRAGPRAAWGYLAFAGGIDAPRVMGSRSTYLRGAFGGLEGRALIPGDRLALGVPAGWDLLARAGRKLANFCLPAYGPQTEIAAIPGPQAEAFTPEALELFFSAEFTLTSGCDRMGYRLAGPKLARHASAELLSEGAPLGAVQVPGDGQPIVLMADRQATGGYAKIAVVASSDLPVLAQRLPGAPVRFRRVDVAEAQARWRALLEGLEKAACTM